jgi:hypothetical protein
MSGFEIIILIGLIVVIATGVGRLEVLGELLIRNK